MAYDGSIKIDTSIDTSKAEAGLAKLRNLAKTGANVVGTAVTATVAGIAAAGTAATKVGSDFEAAMSKVSAISGATGKDLAALTAKAKEMGAKTKFSAAESAQAFGYMAMAGWDTKAMLDGIDGIMSLSAADGLDLATTSDIVTDALTAFGLQAKDSGHFADVLAKASSSANTNVSMLGESFKYVAPLAGSLGYSVEDMSVALGLMANASVKGSMAGTSLKTALSNMAAPTKQMAGVMERYGLSLTDAHGKMLPLADVTQQLRDKLGSLSEAEQSAAASTLFGKEAMSGMLAIINASDKDYQKLVESINNADGAAKQMADTMQDNLQGQFTIFKSSLEGLGLEIYDSLQTPLKEATKTGIEDVNKLTEAFKAGGLESAVAAAGDMFGDLAVSVAEHADGMVNASVQFIEAFVRGIANNSGKLRNAAVSVTKTFVYGLVDLLPKEVAAPIRETINAINRSFNAGSLLQTVKSVSSAVKSAASVAVAALNTILPPLTKLIDKGVGMLGNALQKTAKIVTTVAKAVLPPLGKAIDFVADNLQVLLPAITGVYTALKAYSIITSLTKATAGFAAVTQTLAAAEAANALQLMAANGALTAKEMLVGVVTGKVTLATAAQWAWNTALNANPIGLVVAAVAALAAGIGALCLTMQTELTTEEQLAESQARLTERGMALGDSMTGIAEGMQLFNDGVSSATGVLDGFNDSIIASNERQQELATQMDAIQTEITTIARTATEERRSLTQSEIDRLNELFVKERELADQQLQIQQQYQQVVKDNAADLANNHDMTLAEYEEYAKQIIQSAGDTRDKTVSAAAAERLNTLAEKRALIGTSKEYTDAWYLQEQEAANQRYQQQVDAANKLRGDTSKILADGYLERNKDLQEYNAKATALNKEYNDKELKHIGEMTAIQSRYNQTKQKLDDDLKAGKIGMIEYDRKLRAAEQKQKEAEAEENLRWSKEQNKLVEQLQKLHSNAQLNQNIGFYMRLATDTETYGAKVTKEGEQVVKNVCDAFDALPKDAKNSMRNMMDGAINGIREKTPELWAATSGAVGGVIGMIRNMLDIHSPSRVMRKLFNLAMDGGIVGTDERAPKLASRGAQAAREFVAKTQAELNRANLVARMRATVQANQLKYRAEMEAASEYKAGRPSGGGGGDDKKVVATGTIETHIDIDGREVAIATAPYTAEELGFA